MLENAISSGILSMGVDVLFIGPLPTPGVAYVTRSLRADAGIVITASHNPYDDNGIKFFRADGYKLDDKIENEIEQLVFSGEIENIRPTAEDIGKAVRIDDAWAVTSSMPKLRFPRGHDAGRNADRGRLRARRGLQIDSLRAARAGRGSDRLRQPARRQEHQQGMRLDASRADVPEGAGTSRRLGIAHDGDADRVLLCDETGTLIDGDDIMAIAGLDMLAARHACAKDPRQPR